MRVLCCHTFLSFHCSLVVTFWEMADLLARLYVFLPLSQGGILYIMIFWNYTIYKAKWHMLALWQLGRYCVTALLTTLPYNSFQSSWAKTNLYLNLIYQHANDLKSLN